MNTTSVWLSAKEFGRVHNALYQLGSIIQRLDGAYFSTLADQLVKVEREIRDSLQGAYAQEEQESQARSAHYEQVSDEHKLKSIWSISEVADLNTPHPYSSARHVVYKDHWGDTVVSAEIKGPLWLDLYCAADQCISNSGDNHHVFIEHFTPMSLDPTSLVLSTGS